MQMTMPTVQGFRLSPQQRRLWFLDERESALRARCAVMVTGDLAAEELRAALERVVARHEILRTVFHRTAGMRIPVQVVLERGGVAWQQLDRRGLSPEEQEAELAALFSREGEQVFDAASGPSVRASLVDLSPGRRALVFSLPALCADTLTLRNLVREMAWSVAGGEEPAEPVQYLQFSEWQNDLLEEEAESEGAEHWRRFDLSDLQSLALPGEAPCARPGRCGLASFAWTLPSGLARRVARAAAERKVPEATFLFAGLHALIYRLTGRPETVCGLLGDARKYEELEGVYGPMAGFLPVALQLDDDLPFATLLRRCHRAVEQAVEWQEHFWQDRAGEDISSLPVVFDWDEAPGPLQAGGLTFEILEQCVDVDRPKLRLSCLRRNGELQAALRFDRRFFDHAEIRRLADRYQTLLAGAAEAPQAPLGELEIFGELDRSWLRDLHGVRRDVSGDCFHHLFARQVERTPDAPAAEAGGESLTYAQLDARAGRLALRLRRLGVGRGAIVALYLDRSLAALVGLLATLKADGAYLPLDLAYPKERLRYMLGDSGAAVVLTRERLRGGLPAECPPVLCLDEPAEDGGDEAPAQGTAGPDDLAYVLYTSGSTGRPKGVMISHRGLANYLAWCAEEYRMEEGEGAPVHSSLGFDLTVTSLLGPLTKGRTVVLLDEEDGLEALRSALLSPRRFSLLKITPAHLDVLGQMLAEADPPLRVGTLVVGGEALRAESLRTWSQLAPDSRVVNEYGPTETVVGCCVHEVLRGDGLAGAVPIGRPIAGAEIHLASPRLRPVPAGVAGEILIGGLGLARGYLGRPDLTAGSFIPHPFADVPGERLYRTGDLGRWNADGTLEFLGRIDHQVKIRGFRVELGEIETVLAQHPGVREAVVVARADRGGEPRLVAYTVAAAEEPGADDLRSWLARHLPEHMLPTEHVALRALPLTANGKVDRQALPAPQHSTEATYVAPGSGLELQLARIWEGLLGVSPIGIRDNFFSLGGHSLLAVRMVTQIKKKLGVELPVATVMFQAVTIEALAQRLRESGGAAAWSPLVEIQPGGSERPLFLVHPHGGTVLCYLDLARHLGPDQPVFGLQARGREDRQPPCERIEDMADVYLEALRSVQPAGPYRLGGWSLGGVVAYEMAQRLAAAGETVELLAILDSNLRPKGPLTDDAEFLVEFLGQQLSLSADDVRGYTSLDDLLELVRQRAQEKGLISDDLDIADLRRHFQYYKMTYNAGQLYQPQPYRGKIALVLSTQRVEREARDPSYGLSELAQDGLEIFVLQGLHQDVVRDPKVATVASWLGNLLQRSVEKGALP